MEDIAWMYHLNTETGELFYSEEYHRSREGKRGPKPTRAALGHTKHHQYQATRVPGYKVVTLHRLVWRIHHGEWPADDMTVDHIDNNPRNNRPDNLRLLSLQDNLARRDYSKGTRGPMLPGVTRAKCWAKPYGARRYIQGKQRWLGCYRTEEEAHAAYLAAAPDKQHKR